ncbi:MAG: hypothetical protein ACK54C_09790 [Betaproteobacteria bacterium]
MKHAFSIDFLEQRARDRRIPWALLAIGAMSITVAVNWLDALRRGNSSAPLATTSPSTTQPANGEARAESQQSRRIALEFVDYQWNKVTDAWEALSPLDALITSVTHDARSGTSTVNVLLPARDAMTSRKIIEGLQREGWTVRAVRVHDAKKLRAELVRAAPAAR